MERKTPLYDRHTAAGGKIVPFGGYLLPVQYQTGVITEHMAVRTKAGLFDVSHMGEALLTGPDALRCLNHMFTNDFTDMAVGRVRYSPMCNEQGGVVDDLIVYKLAEDRYFIVVNAANRFKDMEWMLSHLVGYAKLNDISDSVAQLALQGPRAKDILALLTDESQLPAKYYTFTEKLPVAGIDCLVSYTGYTGENGFELYCAPEKACELWDAILAAGAPFGLIPCGLGARDTLRLEAAMPLYGHEMDDTVSPLETGLGFAVKLSKPEFVGRDAMLSTGAPLRERIGLRVTGRGIAREHFDVFKGGERIGETTSGTHCPFVGGPIAMALVATGSASVGDCVEVDIRGRRVEAEVVPLPFYKKPKSF